MNDNNNPQGELGNEPSANEPIKTYTKEDIDNSFNAGVKKANTEWQKNPEYKEFIEWKKTNKDDTQTINDLTSKNDTLTKENNNLNAFIKIVDSDCKKEFRKFVASEVNSLVSDSVDFETALAKFKKDNPQYFGEVIIKKTQTSPNLNGGTQPQTTNQIMNDLLRGK